jgi:predicted nucleic acid-binding protein
VKVALDTNVLAYAEGVNDTEKRDAVLSLLRNLPKEAAVIPVQVLGELFNVLTRKAGKSRADAREAILGWRDAFATVDTTPEVMLAAADLATDHQFGIWDAVILTVASQAGCRLLLSEDLQHGFTWGGTTIANPFASPHHALLELLLEGGSALK